MGTASSSLADLDDGALLRATCRDPEAFGVFYDRHVEDVLSYFVRRTSCSHTAADLTAETFAEALRGSHRYRERRGEPRAWLFGIARHQLTRFIRRQSLKERSLRRLGIASFAHDDASLERIEALIDASHQFEALNDGLRDLSPSVAHAVLLRIGQELSFDEVAQHLGCTPGAARVRVSRGLNQLAQKIHA